MWGFVGGTRDSPKLRVVSPQAPPPRHPAPHRNLLQPRPINPAHWPWAPPSRQVLSGRRHRYVSPISTVTSGSPRAGVGGETRPGDGAVPSTAAFSPGPGSPSSATPEVAAATAAAAPWAAIAVVEVTPESGAALCCWLRVSSSWWKPGCLKGGVCDVAGAYWLVRPSPSAVYCENFPGVPSFPCGNMAAPST